MASLSAPTTLAIFHSPKQKQPTASSSHVTLAQVDGSEGRLAVAAVRGDGVWTYDLKTLKPTTSFTVRPEVEFATGPVSFYRDVERVTAGEDDVAMNEDGPSTSAATVRERVTAVGVQSGGRLTKPEQGRAIWVWAGEDQTEHTQILLSHPLSSLLSTTIASHPLVAVTSEDIVFFSNSLAPHAISLPTPRDSLRLVQARIQSLPSQTGARIVLMYDNGLVALLKVDFEELAVTSLGESLIPGLSRNETVATGDVSQDGTVTAITSTQKVISVAIRPTASSLFAPQPSTVKPTYQRHPSSPPLVLALSSPSTPLAVLASTSSLLLVTSSTALLATSSPAPQSTTPPSIVSLASLQSSDSTTTIAAVLSYDAPARSQVVLIEAHIPASGVGIAHLLGSAAATAAEFTSDLSTTGPLPSTVVASRPSKLNEALLADLEAALNGTDVQAPQTVFTAYLEAADTEFKVAAKTGRQTHALQEAGIVRSILGLVFKRALGPDGISVVDGTVKIVGVASGAIYAQAVVESLLSRKVVVNEYFEPASGGVLAALVALDDWSNVALAIPSLPSVPPSVAVQALNGPKHTEPMLRALMLSQLPVPAYRASLRRSTDAAAALRILTVVLKWVRSWEKRRVESLKAWVSNVDAVERGEKTLESIKVKPAKGPIPDLELVLTQSTILIDALLPVLIAHEPAHALLSELNESLAPLIQLQSEMQALRYPVQAFLTLAKRDEKKPVKDLGNEGVGKWRVEDFLF